MIAGVSGWGGRWGANRHQNGLDPSSLGIEAIRFFRSAVSTEAAATTPRLCRRRTQVPHFLDAWFTKTFRAGHAGWRVAGD